MLQGNVDCCTANIVEEGGESTTNTATQLTTHLSSLQLVQLLSHTLGNQNQPPQPPVLPHPPTQHVYTKGSPEEV